MEIDVYKNNDITYLRPEGKLIGKRFYGTQTKNLSLCVR